MTMRFLLDPGRLMRPVAKRSQEFVGSVVYRISVISSLLECGLNKQTKKHSVPATVKKRKKKKQSD